MEKRRTNPAFLSNDEAARDTKRTEDFVRSIAGNPTINGNVDGKKQVPKEQAPTYFTENPIVRVGETEGFALDFDSQNKMITIYGKEIPVGCPFNLKVGISETRNLICLLEKAKTVMASKDVTRLGEGKSFAVDYDGIQRLVIVYKKETSEFQFKLAMDQNEVTAIINLLMEARTML